VVPPIVMAFSPVPVAAGAGRLLRIADDPEDVVKIIKEAHTDLEF
jgi:hypothetical protein